MSQTSLLLRTRLKALGHQLSASPVPPAALIALALVGAAAVLGIGHMAAPSLMTPPAATLSPGSLRDAAPLPGAAALDAAFWLATDLNPETLAFARAKPAMPRCVRFATADAYTLDGLGPQRFDAAFVGFWWSHVPRARLAGWLDALFARLAPGAPVVFIDNRFVEGSSTPVAEVDAQGDSWQLRRLADGSRHRVLKNHPTRAEVEAALGARAARCDWFGDDALPRHYWAVRAQAA
jgi:demethylmenaquinone methyltransferase/2-methoxy-6-polyprenyl-1,4-benzoquinol methylase